MDRIARIEYFARIGYLGRAMVYFALGYLTLATAHAEGTASVLNDIRELPAGTIVLLLTGLGLAGYGVFRCYGAVLDLEGDGHGVKGTGKRIGHVASGLAHLILAYLSVKLALGGGDGGGSGSSQAARTVMDFPGGTLVVVIVGIGLMLAGINQGVKAATGKFMELLDADAPGWAEAIGRIGFAARAVVFLVIGWNVVMSASGGSTSKIGFQAALESLRQTTWLYQAVAAGLLIFGIFSLIMARYRRIRDQHVIDRLCRKVEAAT